MKSSLSCLAATVPTLTVLLLQVVQPVHGHYGFPVLLINDTATNWFEYVRPVAPDELDGMMFPINDWAGETQVCGINATHTGHLTKTAKVKAGSQLGMRAFRSYQREYEDFNHPFTASDGIWHMGPGQIYMSKAPGDIESYTGDGDWFKIAYIGYKPDGVGTFDWLTYGKGEMNFTVPKTTPPGKYLVRAEHLYVNTQYNETQQFIGCAQIEVTGPGGGTPGPFITFPGGYDLRDPGIMRPQGQPYTEYKPPGPPVWQG
ncbi:glycosyl hydrolase family 61-domain-containing protein [Lophiotrema nucula]|uniref:lytic cellulose monooxygenase (C4-dehydrogenating) n=1 Tax=Lophiotrema nucula TaxID=690887 RepID=A0A6A5YW02_9PLEO|nr:glycosyl hydrolase family 61-domain-containing protein [Lophiotrema nucula]